MHQTIKFFPRLIFLWQVEIRAGCCTLRGPLILFLFVIPLLLLLWPALVPLGLFQFWIWQGSLLNVFALVMPLLVLGMLFTFIGASSLVRSAHYILVAGYRTLLIYLITSPLEELVFRWLLFYGSALLIPLVNFISFGLLKWFYLTILGPVADFVTFHQLHPYLAGTQYSWVIGLAVISSNGAFRDGHKYQGWLGWIWSWFSGMVFFLTMFRYGLFAAMFAHVCYNLFIWALNWSIARSTMTPDEARAMVLRELEEQRVRHAALMDGPVVDSE